MAQNLVKYVVFGALLQKYPMDRLLVLSSFKGYYVSDYWHRWHTHIETQAGIEVTGKTEEADEENQEKDQNRRSILQVKGVCKHSELGVFDSEIGKEKKAEEKQEDQENGLRIDNKGCNQRNIETKQKNNAVVAPHTF